MCFTNVFSIDYAFIYIIYFCSKIITENFIKLLKMCTVTQLILRRFKIENIITRILANYFRIAASIIVLCLCLSENTQINYVSGLVFLLYLLEICY